MLRYGIAFVLLFLCADAEAAPGGGADRARGTYIYSPDLETASPAAPLPNGDPRILYLARDGGAFCCPDRQNPINDAAHRISSLACGSPSIPECGGHNGFVLSPNNLSDEDWAAVVRCVQLQFGRFALVVTDQYPGDVNFVEAAIAGSPSEAGFPGVGGVAPFACDIIERAVVYTFASLYPNNPRAQCEVTAQEVAHAYGLDHELYCPDPMTYLDGCGDKWFQDVDVPCGEFQARTCTCGGQTQNSVQLLLDRLGPGEHVPPVVNILSPADGASVDHEFDVTVDVTDNYLVNFVEYYVDGELVRRAEAPPFDVKLALPVAAHTIEVLAFDAGLSSASDSIQVTVTPQCGGNEDCTAGPDLVCENQLCVGGYGADCRSQDDCTSSLFCGFRTVEGVDTWRCTDSCTHQSDCPSGFVCDTNEVGASLCWPGSTGSCTVGVAGTRSLGAGTLVAGVAMLLGVLLVRLPFARRRRRRR